MASMASYLCLLILSPLLLLSSFHFHMTHCRLHPPLPSRKLSELPTSTLFIPPPAFAALVEPRQQPTFPSFQEPLLPPGPVANYLLPHLPFPPNPFPPIHDIFPPLPLFPPGLLNPVRPLLPGHSTKNEMKNVDLP